MLRKLKYLCLLLVVLLSCIQNETVEKEGFITIEGQKFVDSKGRQILFNGINYISKNPKEKYMPQHTSEVIWKFKKWGFNCIRLGIIWDGLEPEPGKYNEEYLEQMDRRIHDETLLYYIYADNGRGIELIADWNVMWNEIRIIQELHKRFSKWEDED